MAEASDWVIRWKKYRDNPNAWTLRLGNCSQEHAETVLESLAEDPYTPHPSELELVEVGAPPKRRRFWRR